MARRPLPSGDVEGAPAAPQPSVGTAEEGVERTRAMARRYLFDALRLLAGIAFSRGSEAALHTRMLAAKEIISLAGAVPPATPAAPANVF